MSKINDLNDDEDLFIADILSKNKILPWLELVKIGNDLPILL